MSVIIRVERNQADPAACLWVVYGVMLHAIPVGTGREAVAAIVQARHEIEQGHVVCIFAEGAITRTGNLFSTNAIRSWSE